MKIFLLKEKPDKKGLVRLTGEDYHYLVHVRRLKPGVVFNARLEERPAAVTVVSIDNQILTGSVCFGQQTVKETEEQTVPIPPIILFQSLPKGNKMDLIVRQAAETGISEIVPFISEHSIPKDIFLNSKRLERWQRIIKEARQQSNSAINTQINGIVSNDGIFTYWKTLQKQTTTGLLGLVFSPGLVNDSFHGYLYKKPSLIVLVVGPEGGFSDNELNRFATAGFRQLSLGTEILRTETAAIFGTAAAKIILMEGPCWTLKQQ